MLRPSRRRTAPSASVRPTWARAALPLAVALLATACTIEETTGPGDDGPGAPPPANGAVPSAVVGNWRYGSVSPTNFYNDHTGAYSGNAYGFSRHYAFERDGTYKDYVYIYAESYGCRQQNWVEMSGTVQFTGADFTTTVTAGRFKTVDSCSASNDKDRPMTASERNARSTTSAYALRTDANGKAYLSILDGRFDRVP